MTCSICLDEIDSKMKGIVTLHCNHSYHSECIKEWLNNHSNCPYCRKYISSTIDVKVFKYLSVFGNSAIINIPKDNSLEIIIYIKKKLFSKKIILNRFCLKQYTFSNFNRLIIEYFDKFPNLKKCILQFKNYEDLEEITKHFNRMFEYNKNNIN